MKFIAYNEDEGRNEFVSHVEGESRKYSALQSLLSGRKLDQEEVESLKEFKEVQQFLDSPVGDASEAKLKKVFAAAIIIANEQGTLPFSINAKSPIAIASAVDEGLNRVKLSYKLANEDLDAIEVADKLIDATVARVITVADKVIERGVPVVLNRVCDVIVKVYPPASVFVPVIKNAEKFIVPATAIKTINLFNMLIECLPRTVSDGVLYNNNIIHIGSSIALHLSDNIPL